MTRPLRTPPADSPENSAPDHLEAPVQACIVTGLSGAGKSTALQVFEDLRYFSVDGLPASMAPEMVGMMERPSMSHFKGIALGMDMRQNNFPDEINEALSAMTARGIRPLLLFLEADTQELMRRYATHPPASPAGAGGHGPRSRAFRGTQQLEPVARDG